MLSLNIVNVYGFGCGGCEYMHCVWINCICGCKCIVQILKFELWSWLYFISVFFFKILG
jgi:hypothetical protein